MRIKFYHYSGRGFLVTYHMTKDHDSLWTRFFGFQIGPWFIGAVKGNIQKEQVTMTMNERMIRVWLWKDAPATYRALSRHAGDEDWIAVVPKAMVDEYIPWLDESKFSNDVQMSVHGEDLVYIGAHA